MTEQPFIFVTVGSTDFDALIKAVDVLLPALDRPNGVMQIGHGQYVPGNMPYFRFAPTLDAYFEQASLVIAHGGLATTMEVLRRGVPLISVSNPDRYDNHQEDLLAVMAEENYLVWCRQLNDLEQAIKLVQTTPLQSYQPPKCEIHLIINEFLNTDYQNSLGRRLLGRSVRS